MRKLLASGVLAALIVSQPAAARKHHHKSPAPKSEECEPTVIVRPGAKPKPLPKMYGPTLLTEEGTQAGARAKPHREPRHKKCARDE